MTDTDVTHTEPGGQLGPATAITAVWSCVPCQSQSGNGTIKTGTFTSKAGGNLYAFWTMSAWSHSDDVLLEAELVAGTLPNALTDVVTNASDMHVALLRRRAMLGGQPAGQVEVSAKAQNGSTVTSAQDLIGLTVIEMGSPAIWELSRRFYGPANPGESLYATVPFTSRGGDLVVCVSASGYSASSSGGPIGAIVRLDGHQRASIGIYANYEDTHLAMVPADFIFPGVAAGDHVLTLTPADGTSISATDYSEVTVLEILAPPSVVARAAVLSCAPAISQNGSGVVASGVFASNGGNVLVTVAASAYTDIANTMIGMFIQIDDATYGTLQVFANYEETHLCLVGCDLNAGVLPAGLHTVTLMAFPGTVTDGDDRCSITIIEVPQAWT